MVHITSACVCDRYPTIKVFPAGAKSLTSVVDYQGPRQAKVRPTLSLVLSSLTRVNSPVLWDLHTVRDS